MRGQHAMPTGIYAHICTQRALGLASGAESSKVYGFRGHARGDAESGWSGTRAPGSRVEVEAVPSSSSKIARQQLVPCVEDGRLCNCQKESYGKRTALPRASPPTTSRTEHRATPITPMPIPRLKLKPQRVPKRLCSLVVSCVAAQDRALAPRQPRATLRPDRSTTSD